MGVTAAAITGIAVAADEHPAAPAADAATTVEEITVSATRRGEQNQLAVPLAVDALTSAQLESAGVTSLADVSKLDPSLNVQSNGATQQYLVIRGVASNIGQTTGIYLNETPLFGGFDSDVFGDGSPGLRLHDLDHIEILKGPQGTLFGAGSMDGTLRVVTAKPDLLEYSGAVNLGYGNVDGGNNLYKSDAVVNAPIIDGQLGARLAVWDETGGGYVDNPTLGLQNVNDEHLAGGRLTLLFKPLDGLTLTASWNFQRAVVGGSQEWTQYVGSTVVFPGQVGPFSAYNNASPTQEPYYQRYSLFDLTAEYDLGFGSVIATAGYGHKHDQQPDDSTPTLCQFACAFGPAKPLAYSPVFDYKDLTTELRFSSRFSGPFQLVAGGYFEHDQTDSRTSAITADADGTLPCYTWQQCTALGLVVPGFGPTGQLNRVVFAQEVLFNTSQYAVYAQGDYKILDNLTATLGVRYFSADLTQTDIQQQDIGGGPAPGWANGDVTTPYVSLDHAQGKNTKTTYNAALLFAVTPDISVYARAASGFRIGGINDQAAIAAQTAQASGTTIDIPGVYQPDSLWDYEGGVKAYLLDHKWFLEATYYHIDWTNQQVNVNAAGAFDYVANVGKTSTNGAELGSTFTPFKGLTLTAYANYVDARLEEDLPGYGVAGDREPLSPEWSFAAGGEFVQPLGGSLKGYVGGNVTYRGGSQSAFPQDTPNIELPAYMLLDLAAGVRLHNFDFSVYGQNVTNRVTYTGVQIDQDAYRIYSANPQTIGVRVKAHF